MEEIFNQLLKQVKELTEQLQLQSAQLQLQNNQLAELQEITCHGDGSLDNFFAVQYEQYEQNSDTFPEQRCQQNRPRDNLTT